MARQQTATIQLAAASAASVATSQTPTSSITLTANPVNLVAARRVLVTNAAGDAGKTILITGTDRGGMVISETLVLTAASSYTAQDFLTVSSAVISAAAAGALTMGTNGVASTRWIKLTPHIDSFAFSTAISLNGGAASTQVEVTLDEPDYVTGATVVPGGYQVFQIPAAFPAPGTTASNSDTFSFFTCPVQAVRLTVISGGTATIRFVALQSGLI